MSAVNHPAVAFLQSIFAPGDRICIAEKGEKGFQTDFRSLEEICTDSYLKALAEKNDAGVNIYVAMNAILPGHTRRRKEDIGDIRSAYLDLDTGGREKLDAILASSDVPSPTVGLESSTGKYQVIWALRGVTKDQQERILDALIVKFGGDPAASDCSRVLRLPGFFNTKYDDLPLVNIVYENGVQGPYSADDFKVQVTLQEQKQKPWEVYGCEVDGPEIPLGEHDVTLHSIAGKLRSMGWEQDAIYDRLFAICVKRVPARGKDWEEMIKKHATRICEKPAGVETTVTLGDKPPGQGVAPSVPSTWTEPQSLGDELSPVAAYKLQFLPLCFRPFAKDVSERMSVPLDFIGNCLMTVASGVTGRRAFMHPKANDKDWKEALALSGCVIASSGEMKTPTWKVVTKIVDEKEIDWENEHKELKEKYDRELEAWEAAEKKAREDEKKTGVMVSVPPPPTEPGKARRLKLNDATPEVMMDIMKNNPQGMLYYRDELSSWIAELDKEGRESQLGVFLAAMNGDDVATVDRIGREGGRSTMCAAVFGGIQPDPFRDFINNTKNVSTGLVPRFPLACWPDKTVLPLIDRAADDNAKQQVRKVLRTLADMNEKQVSMHFTVEAQPVFDQWLAKITEKTRSEENRGKSSHLAKYRGSLPKLAALSQLIDQVNAGPCMGTHTVDLAHLNAAIEYFDYLETHMHRIYDSFQNPVQVAASEIAKHMRKKDLKPAFTTRDVLRKHWKYLTKTEFIDFGLELLEEKGWLRSLEPKSGPQGGRPTVVWKINPALL